MNFFILNAMQTTISVCLQEGEEEISVKIKIRKYFCLKFKRLARVINNNLFSKIKSFVGTCHKA